MSHSAEKKLEMSNFGLLLCFPGCPFVSFFFCFAQGFEISSVLNLPQVVEQMD